MSGLRPEDYWSVASSSLPRTICSFRKRETLSLLLRTHLNVPKNRLESELKSEEQYNLDRKIQYWQCHGMILFKITLSKVKFLTNLWHARLWPLYNHNLCCLTSMCWPFRVFASVEFHTVIQHRYTYWVKMQNMWRCRLIKNDEKWKKITMPDSIWTENVGGKMEFLTGVKLVEHR